jgi:L-alanine-DL-glutamate epimerase-like enolase superfamily enzyme
MYATSLTKISGKPGLGLDVNKDFAAKYPMEDEKW